MSQNLQTSNIEKSSPYIKHISFINIIKKTKRTLLSVVAVMISVAIIYTSLNLFINVYHLTKSETTPQQGNYHYILQSLQADHASRHTVTLDDNLNLYGLMDGQTVNIRTTNNQDYLPFTITQGSYPKNDQEIVVPATLGYQIGDSISLDLTTRKYDESNLLGLSTSKDEEETKETYLVTGLYESSNTFASLTKDTICLYTNRSITNQLHTIYVFDSTIQYSDSVSFAASYYNIDEKDIILNNEAIDYDTIRNYLQDTTTLLVMFIFIVILAFLISIISLKNVFITSDKDRKKEFGLLKSIGATKADLKKLLVIELSLLGLIGAVLGIILGIAVSYVVIKLFTKQLSILITTSMVMNPILLIFAFAIGFLMILIIGFKSYRPYLSSNPIDDLKENTYNYDPPVHKPSYTAKSFSWKMFLIYNNRLKAQTRNIFQSFTLLIMTTVLFTGILLSNLFYEIDIGNIKYDYELNSMTTSTLEPTNPEFIQDLYQAVDHQEIYPKKMTINHSTNRHDYYVETSKLDEENILAYKKVTRVAYEEKEMNKTSFSKIYLSQFVYDYKQQEEMEKLTNTNITDLDLQSGGVVLFLEETSSAAELFKNFKVGDYIYLSETWKEPIKQIVTYPSGTAFATKYQPMGNFERAVYMDYDYYISKFGEEEINDYIQITLDNKATSSKATVVLEKLISKHDVHFKFTNMIEIRKECKIISFILQSLLYPLFVMLFIISIININNVLIGNIELKRGDISILKSVGMSSGQLYGFIAYEYMEGYINASFIAVAIFIPLCIIENKLGLTSAFKLGENAFSTLLISIIIVDILIVAGLVVLSLRSMKKIDAIENMKNIT